MGFGMMQSVGELWSNNIVSPPLALRLTPSADGDGHSVPQATSTSTSTAVTSSPAAPPPTSRCPRGSRTSSMCLPAVSRPVSITSKQASGFFTVHPSNFSCLHIFCKCRLVSAFLFIFHLLFPLAVIQKLIECSHVRSYEYFTEALKNPECRMWGHKTSTAKQRLK